MCPLQFRVAGAGVGGAWSQEDDQMITCPVPKQVSEREKELS